VAAGKRFARRILGTRPAPLSLAAVNLLSEIGIRVRVQGASRQFRALEGRRDLKLHLGCGPELKPGWINVDLYGNAPADSAEGIFVKYDLRSGVLPLADGCCDFIYSSHFFEHLEYPQGLALMRDCYRVLRKGGTFRAALPNFRGMFREYLAGNDQYFDLYSILDVLPYLEPGTETLVDHVNYGVYQSGEHKCIYDEEKLCLLLRHVGFSSVDTSPYKAGLDPESELRRRASFYVEAVK